MKVFVIFLFLASFVIPITFTHTNAESDVFRFIGLNESYDLGDDFLIKFEKTTQQPCPSYEVSMMKKGFLESKMTYGVEPLCAIPDAVEPYLFNAEFEKSKFFDSVGTYIIQVTLDDETIQKEITIINNRNLENKLNDSFTILQKQVKYVIPYKITSGAIDNMQLNCKPLTLTVDISSNDSGILQMEIPKTMMRSIFSILVNDQEWENVSIDGNTLTVTFPKFSKTIVIHSGYLLTSDKNRDGACDIIHEPPYSFIISPQQQFQSGISFDEIQCKQNLVLVQKYDGTPACVTESTKTKLVERGWTYSTMSTKSSECSTDMKEYPLSKPLSDVYANRLVLFIQPESTASFCVYYKSNLDNTGTRDITPTLYTGEILLEKYEGPKVSVDVEPKNVSLERGTETFAKFTVTTTQNSTGVYHIIIPQLSRLPLVVWEDRQSVGANEIPVYSGFRSSGNIVLDAALLWHEEDDFLNYSVAEIRR